MDEMRAMLDELMGKERNLNLEERDKYRPEQKHFTDSDVCKFFICGFCPYEEFRRTKNDCGDCPHLHDEGCRRQWDELPDREKERYGYERELMRRLDRLLLDLRKRIDANTERLSATEQPLYLAEDQAQLDALARKIDELLAAAAKLGENGEVDAAQAATAEAEAVRERRAGLERAADSRSGNNATRNLVQSVCPVSGLIINDEESRLRDHHTGRNYNSWRKLHEVHARLAGTFRRRDEERRGRPPPAAVPEARPADALRGRDGGLRDRDGGGDRRKRSRSRDRRRRSRSRDRRRRSRSRSRDRDRRRRSRSRSRGRDYRSQRVGRRERSPFEEGERGKEEGEVGAAAREPGGISFGPARPLAAAEVTGAPAGRP